jgi:hypothetical protein
MKVNFSKLEKEVKKFQEGGAMPAEGGAPASEPAPAGAPEGGAAPAGPEGGVDPMQQILQAAMQAVQTKDGQLALQVCAALVQLAQGGAGAPTGAPAEGAPEGEPVYRKGGRLAYRKK